MASPLSLALAQLSWRPPPCPNTAISFQVFNPSLLPLNCSPSPFIPAAWEALLYHYPGDLGRVCNGILIYGCQIGSTAPPVYRYAGNNSIDDPLIITRKLAEDLSYGASLINL